MDSIFLTVKQTTKTKTLKCHFTNITQTLNCVAISKLFYKKYI